MVLGYSLGRSPIYPAFTTMGNLDLVDLICIFLGYAKKLVHPEETYTDTGKTCTLHTVRPKSACMFEPGSFLL